MEGKGQEGRGKQSWANRALSWSVGGIRHSVFDIAVLIVAREETGLRRLLTNLGRHDTGTEYVDVESSSRTKTLCRPRAPFRFGRMWHSSLARHPARQ